MDVECIQVLTPCNFIDHKFVKTNNEELVKKGFMIGAKVELTRRITVEFGPDAFRKDIVKSTTAFIKGIVDGMPVVTFSATVGKQKYDADVKIKPDNLKVYIDKTEEATLVEKAAKGKEKEKSEYEYLQVDGSEAIADVVGSWSDQQCSKDVKYLAQMAANMAAFTLANAARAAPSYNEKDLTVVKRGNAHEVWTKRDFKANEFIFVPETLDVRDRYWSAGKSVLLEDSEVMMKELVGKKAMKSLVADGRFRSTPNAAGGTEGRAFSLYWLVSSSKDADGVNMDVAHQPLKWNVQGSFPGGGAIAACSPMPKVHVMFNPRPITARTKLLVREDAKLLKLTTKVQQQMLKEKQAASTHSTAASSTEKSEKPPAKKAKTTK